MEIAVWLHNVRSAHNVGSIFRTADAAGISRIFLSGYTPTPIDRFGRAQKALVKTALGAERTVPWEYAKTPRHIIKKLKPRYHLIGIEQDPRAKDYRTRHPARDTVFVFGNEVRGLSGRVRELCDEIWEIRMRGKKESLNISVAAGIILFAALDQ